MESPAEPTSVERSSRAKKGKAPAARRRRSSSRRRIITAEVRKREIGKADVYSLQGQLLSGSASEQLMDAARGLLQAKDYNNVVLERAIEGVCGYPPCEEAAAGTQGKKWNINAKDRHVYDASEVGRFCSMDCMKKSGEFAMRLEPEPPYIRSADAVATSRGAVSQASEDSRAKSAVVIGDSPVVGTSPSQTKIEESAPAGGSTRDDASCLDLQAKNALPKVRPKAVVRFSREQQNYSVHYADYDSGGAIPGLPSVRDSHAALPKATENKGDAVATAQRLLAAPIVESTAVLTETSSGVSRRAENEQVPKDDSISDAETDEDGAAEDTDGFSIGGDAFFDLDPFDASQCGALLSESIFVRCWGALTNWMSDTALYVLAGNLAPGRDEDEDPLHQQRRMILANLLFERLPGDLTFLSPRLSEFMYAVSVHQVMPPVTDFKLYDLLTPMLLEWMLKADIQSGVITDTELRTDLEKIIEGRLRVAAKAAGVSDDELVQLQAIVVPKCTFS